MLPLPAETSREAPKCASRGGPETRSGTVQSLKCCPCQQKRAARLPSAAPGSIEGGGPETRSGTVQSLKCCPCQQKRAARLPSAAPGSIKGGPRNALGHRPEPEVLPLPAETSREAPKKEGGGQTKCSIKGGGGPETRCCTVQSSQVLRLAASRGGPRNALGYRPEPEVLPLPAETSRKAPKCCAWRETRSGTVQSLKCSCQQKRAARLPSAAPGCIKGGGPETRSPAETSREAPKCCAWQHQGGGPRNALGHRPEPEVCPCQQKRAARLPLPLPAETSREAPKCCAWQHQERGPETRSGTVQSLKCCPCQQKRAARLPSAAPGSMKGGGPETRSGTVQSLKCCPCQQKRAARLPSAAPGSIKGKGPETRSGTVQSLKCVSVSQRGCV